MTLPPTDPGVNLQAAAGLLLVGAFIAVWAFIIFDCSRELRDWLDRRRANRRKP